MNRKWHSLMSSLLTMMIAVCMVHTCPALAAFRAAIVLRNVTPAPLLPVSGGVGPSEPVNRKVGELTVRALVLEKEDTRVAICSTDFLGFPGVLCSRVRRQVSGIPPENILIGATHNHSGPDCYPKLRSCRKIKNFFRNKSAIAVYRLAWQRLNPM